jgi:hypothetical protein
MLQAPVIPKQSYIIDEAGHIFQAVGFVPSIQRNLVRRPNSVQIVHAHTRRVLYAENVPLAYLAVSSR